MTKINIDNDRFVELRKEGKTLSEVAKIMNISVRSAERWSVKIKNELTKEDIDVIEENVRLAKQKQRLQDLNRIERKSFREYARLENAVEELQVELIKLMDKHVFPKTVFNKKKQKTNKKVGGVLHLSDTHFNELINLLFNKYDFGVASKRLKKFVDDSKEYFKAKGVKDICVCMTGDLINSDRRLDELLSQATNRAKACLLSIDLLEQVLMDLQLDFNVSVASVIGNESRITEDIGWVEDVASDNYDFIIHQMLKRLFKNSNINFIEGHKTEKIIEISGQNILLVHGNQVSGSKMEDKIQKIIGKYSLQKTQIDFVLSSHLHSCRISDNFARNSSLAGGNAYSDNGLQLYSRASQNIHIFFDNGNRDSIKIDLQNVDEINGYKIDKNLEAYNAKSINKAKKKVTIHKLVM